MHEYNVVGFFCEDIRDESGGGDRNTLVGTFPDNVNVAQIPSIFPKLGIYVRVHLSFDFKVEELFFGVRFPGGEFMKLAEFKPSEVREQQEKARSMGAPFAGFIFKAVAAPAGILAPGHVAAIVSINGEESIAAFMNVQQEQVVAD